MESINVLVDDSIIMKEIDIEEDVGTSSQMNGALEDVPDIESNIESVGIESEEALTDEFYINVIQEKLGQFKRNEVWDLAPRPEGTNVIGTKWVYKNKSDEKGVFTRNKARLMAQGYTQIKGVDFDETYSLVARLESIRLLLGWNVY
ncbi:uncharacterized mitochondrial protein AtMg00820-like [Lathyrus oleraceus]|uniref:uncharacterized mitochondrial protein AtMg00820-like n=1 Tax=Pisum sativum TaxID=3888 RepID=UPI0021CFAE3D|nr:uncharacterized mitochondrial protein AtMg00820-like [Pisum sativum]